MLGSQQIHVWPIHLDGVTNLTVMAKFQTLLSQEETDRAARFAFEHLKQSYILAHGAVRILLSGYTGVPPERIEFRYAANGKPSLSFATEVRFNLSHCGPMALLAVATCEVGVDIEQLRPGFEPSALQRWARQEAYVKATGAGLSDPPGSVDPRWTVCDLESVPGYAAAIAFEGQRSVEVMRKVEPAGLLTPGLAEHPG